MKIETLNKAMAIYNQVSNLKRELELIDESEDLCLCHQYSSGNFKGILHIDDNLRRFIIGRLIREKERLEKELEEL